MILGGLLTVRQAATELRVSVRSVHHLIEKGDLAADKVGDGLRAPLLITRDELDRYKAHRAAS